MARIPCNSLKFAEIRAILKKGLKHIKEPPEKINT